MTEQNSGDNIKIKNVRDSTIIVKSTVGAEPKEIPIPWMAPEPPDDFVPRPQEFEQLLGYLLGAAGQGPVAITTALRGAGGYGKTTLAAALCHDQRVRDAFPQGILWITLGENPTNLPGLVEDVVYALTGERPGFVDLNAAAATLAQAWGERRCLLVVDDVWNEAHLHPFLRDGSGCTRLITTRNRETLPPAVQMVDVDAMQQNEAVALLSANLPASETAPLRWPLQKLAQRLGEWPTLLKLINRVLQRRSQQQPLAQAVAYVNEALDRRGLTAFDQRHAAARHQAVAQTIGVSLELLTADEQQRLAELAIFPEDVAIPLLVVQKLWQATGGLDAFESEELCQQLFDLSLLLKYQPRIPQSIQLHDVLRGYFLGQLGKTAANIHYQLFRSDIYAGSLKELMIEPYLRRYMIYHLHGAGQMEVLRQQLLNVGWMQGKLGSSDMAELLADYDYLPADPDVQTVKLALQMAAPFLTRYKGQLLGQLHGRLLDQPSSAIQAMLAEGRDFCASSGYLIPTTPTLPSPHNSLLITLFSRLGRVLAVAITPDDRHAVSASDDKTLKVWNLQTGQAERTLSGHLGRVWAVAITPDGKRAVSASDDKTLRVWNLQTGQAERTLSGHSGWVLAVAITPDGRHVVSASGDKTLKFWNLQTGQAERTLSGHSGRVWAIAITPDGRRAVSASDDKTLKVWNLQTGQAERTFSGHAGFVTAVAITPDGGHAVSASDDKTLKVWNLSADAPTGQAERTLFGHSGGVRAVAITLDGRHAVSASWDHTLKVWNLQTGQVEHTLSGHEDWVMAVAITSDGGRAISASYDKTLKVWNLTADAPTRQAERDLSRHAGFVNAIAITPDGRRAVSASDDKTLKVWNLQTREAEHTLSGHSGRVWGVTITPDGWHAVSASDDYTFKVWNLRTGQAERTLSGHSGWGRAVAITPDSRRAVSMSDNKTLEVWNLQTGQTEHTLSGHKGFVTDVAITPGGGHAVSASDDKTLKVWNLQTGQAERTLLGHSGGVRAITITPDGRRAISASDDKTLKVWNLQTGQAERTLLGHSGGVRAITITPDGRRAISASDDKTLKVWNLQTGQIERSLYDHKVFITANTITPDGGRAISASYDQALKVLNLANGKVEMELDLGARLYRVAMTPNGQTIVVGDDNGTVHFLRWQRP